MIIYKDTRDEYIDQREKIAINLEKALKEIDSFPTKEHYRNGILGFINDKGEKIQLFRFGPNEWLIDVPLLQAEKPPYAYQDDEVTTTILKEVIKRFQCGTDWQSLLKLHPA